MNVVGLDLVNKKLWGRSLNLGSLPNSLDPDEPDRCDLSAGLQVAQREGDEPYSWEEGARASVNAGLSTQTKPLATACQEGLCYCPPNFQNKTTFSDRTQLSWIHDPRWGAALKNECSSGRWSQWLECRSMD